VDDAQARYFDLKNELKAAPQNLALAVKGFERKTSLRPQAKLHAKEAAVALARIILSGCEPMCRNRTLAKSDRV